MNLVVVGVYLQRREGAPLYVQTRSSSSHIVAINRSIGRPNFRSHNVALGRLVRSNEVTADNPKTTNSAPHITTTFVEHVTLESPRTISVSHTTHFTPVRYRT